MSCAKVVLAKVECVYRKAVRDKDFGNIEKISKQKAGSVVGPDRSTVPLAGAWHQQPMQH